jgi:hypothetical protein
MYMWSVVLISTEESSTQLGDLMILDRRKEEEGCTCTCCVTEL